jgi:hypothetical protein
MMKKSRMRGCLKTLQTLTSILSQRERRQESKPFPEPSPSEVLGRGSLEERGEGKSGKK